MGVIVGFFRFWYDFIVGDDWIVAAAIAVALVVLYVLPGKSGLWWLLPLVVIAALGSSLWRATRT